MASTFDFSKSRYSQLEWELKYALDNTSKEEFKEWANEQRAMYGMEKLDNVQLTSLLN